MHREEERLGEVGREMGTYKGTIPTPYLGKPDYTSCFLGKLQPPVSVTLVLYIGWAAQTQDGSPRTEPGASVPTCAWSSLLAPPEKKLELPIVSDSWSALGCSLKHQGLAMGGL